MNDNGLMAMGSASVSWRAGCISNAKPHQGDYDEDPAAGAEVWEDLFIFSFDNNVIITIRFFAGEE